MAASSNTLFVRNLPYSATNETLEETFSELGPLKRCFVVKKKGESQCRGFGYVTFALREDAEKAMKTTVKVEKRKLLIDIAKKEFKVKRKKDEEMDVPVPAEIPKPTNEEDKEDDKKTSYTKMTRTVVLTKLPEGIEREDIDKLLKRTENIESIQFPVIEGKDTSAHILYERCKDAKSAIGRLHRKKVKGSKLNADLLARARKTYKNMKNSRLIVRNLSFKCSEDDLKTEFGVHGEISEVSIPKMANGKMFGYAFVQYTNVIDGAKAIKHLNMTKIKGRPVAVDWAVPKQQYEKAVNEEKSKQEQPAANKQTNKKEVTKKKEEQPKESDHDEDEESEESDGSHGDDGGASEEEESEQNVKNDDDDDDDNDEDDNNDDNDDDLDESDDDDEDDSDDDEEEKPKVTKPSDVSEGKTLFIRNLPFDLEEEDVAEHFMEYGKIAYCKLLVNPDTERSRGSAFVKFRKPEEAEKCLKKASEEDKAAGISINGRKLLVTMAVSRDDAEKLRKDQKDKKENKQTKDKRNLHLAREGLIRPGTKAAESLSKTDLLKRKKLEMQKRQKLQNLNIFISPTRLSVHNLPKSVDDKKLKEIFRKAVDEKGVFIKEARVMRDMSAVTTTGTPKSLGYAFVAFSQHEHALKALRELNNNADIFGEDKRPIVEFSLENRLAHQAKERRLQKSIAKQQLSKEEKSKAMKDLKSKSSQVSKKTETDQKQKVRKGLPSHFGAKKRWRNRGKQVETKKPKNKMSRSKKVKTEVPVQSIPQVPAVKRLKAKKMKRKRPARSDKFDKIVNQYQNKKAKVSKPPNMSKKKNSKPWFE